MATMASSHWCLRFLGGAVKGRTLALKPGPNVVGSSGECDIMLPGRDVLPRHLVFGVGEMLVSVQKIGTAAVRLNGEEMQQPRRSLVTGDIVAVGQIELQLERSYPAAETPDPMFAEPESVPGDVPPAEPTGSRSVGFRVGAVLLALAGLGLLGVWLREAAPASGGGTGISLANVERAIAPFGEVEVTARPGGQLVVRGFVETHQRKQALQQAVQAVGRVGMNVYATDDLVEQARRYVGEPGIAISYAGKGRLVVSGTGDDATVREKVRRLGEDLHPAVIVADKVQYRPAPPVDKDAEQRAQWAAWQELLPARLVSITEGGDGLRSIQLANGNRYYEGAVLKSGAELERIDADGLLIRGGKRNAATK
jgi:type III secretion system YscD/HrpQ family protein